MFPHDCLWVTVHCSVRPGRPLVGPLAIYSMEDDGGSAWRRAARSLAAHTLVAGQTACAPSPPHRFRQPLQTASSQAAALASQGCGEQGRRAI